MKTLGYVLIGFVSIFCLTGIVSSNVEASEYLGDFCWQFNSQPNNLSIVLRLGVSHMGELHFSLSGTEIYGNAGVQSDGQINMILFMVHDTGVDSTSNSVIHAVLDPNTLNGTFKGIDTWANSTKTNQGTEYHWGTLTFIQCP